MMKESRDAAIRESVKRYIEALRKRNIEVVTAYLYGSYAQGKATVWSDIDVAVLTKKFIGDSFDFKFLLMKIARDVDFNIEPHPFLADEFTEDDPIAAEVMRTGEKVA